MQKLSALHLKDAIFVLLEIILWEINQEHRVMKEAVVIKEAEWDSK